MYTTCRSHTVWYLLYYDSQIKCLKLTKTNVYYMYSTLFIYYKAVIIGRVKSGTGKCVATIFFPEKRGFLNRIKKDRYRIYGHIYIFLKYLQ